MLLSAKKNIVLVFFFFKIKIHKIKKKNRIVNAHSNLRNVHILLTLILSNKLGYAWKDVGSLVVDGTNNGKDVMSFIANFGV